MGCMFSKSLSDSDDAPVLRHDFNQEKKLDLLADEGANLQDDLWQESFQNKLSTLSSKKRSIRELISTEATFDSSLQNLTHLYNTHGFASRMPQVLAILTSLQPFTAAINSMAQAHPEVACLVWGSMQLVYQVIKKYHDEQSP